MLKDAERPLPEVFCAVADAGYAGVELVHDLHGADLARTERALVDAGLTPIAVHIPLATVEADPRRIVDHYRAIGCRSLVYHPDLYVRTERRVREVADRCERLAQQLHHREFRLLYHPNHRDLSPLLTGPVVGQLPWFTHRLESTRHPASSSRRQQLQRTLNRVGTAALEYLEDRSNAHSPQGTALGYWLHRTSTVAFELDTGFVAHMGGDPGALIERFGSRIPIVHMKDVRADGYARGRWPRWVDPGEGRVDFAATATAARRHGVEWVIFESHTDDPMQSIERGADCLAAFCT